MTFAGQSRFWDADCGAQDAAKRVLGGRTDDPRPDEDERFIWRWQDFREISSISLGLAAIRCLTRH
jgi:hypothetical protein